MKKAIQFLMGALSVGLLYAAVGFAGQSPNAVNPALNTSGYYSAMNLDAQGDLLQSQGTNATNAISGVPVVVKASAGRLVQVNVISASGIGAIYDSATVASGVAANKVATIPAAVGTYFYDWPMVNGIVVDPSSNVIAVKYN